MWEHQKEVGKNSRMARHQTWQPSRLRRRSGGDLMEGIPKCLGGGKNPTSKQKRKSPLYNEKEATKHAADHGGNSSFLEGNRPQ